ncbi:glycosyltransferase family 4 protein [Sabulicella glaciei]|uniref:Glycosyltransferase family 4 protein n=1 Tax=Sabulicella glaciei TaxID=2984948 RepID=A0ABT3NX39_9PROT|nr:glycosyltransferase family 1 protein [Roseococcus sp. MDT2-1-1]MCW8086468.1 glycosyltransferase family 4 protein [Roseococcus sp. MDT2-1-1]
MIFLNGRFLAQGLTGVQRYAREIARALDAMVDRPPVALLCPPDARDLDLFPRLAPRIVGTRGGQIWEQWILPRAARGGTLLSLGNTGPLLAGRHQSVVIHDAGAFDTPESYGTAFRLWYRGVQTTLARRGARILTVSHFSAGRIAHHLRIAEPPATLEGGEHILREPADAAILARYGLEAERFALVVGTGAAHKNLAALHAAGGALASRGLVLAVAGAKDTAVFRAGGADLPGEVRALGRVSDAELRALYEAALALLFPSRYEGFGLPPVEAMWCGCPVVAAPLGALPEVCGEAAVPFDPRRPASLGEAVARLADDAALRAGLAEAGRRQAAQFSWDAAARRLLGFIAA